MNKDSNRAFVFLRKAIEEELEQLELYVLKSLQLLDSIKVKSYPSLDGLNQFFNTDEGKRLGEGLKFSFQSIHISPFIVKHSVFVSVYSFLEYSLKIISQYVAYDINTSVRKVNNFEKLYQYYDFLTTDAGLDRDKYKANWDLLNVYRDIRNSITHHNSTIGKNISSNTLKYLKTSSEIKLDDFGSFQFQSNAIIEELLSLTKRLLIAILNDYDQIKNHQKQ